MMKIRRSKNFSYQISPNSSEKTVTYTNLINNHYYTANNLGKDELVKYFQ